MSGLWRAVTSRRSGKWSVWKFNWLANHKIVRALERARPHAHGLLLDVGCGAKPFAPLFRGHVTHYYGADLPASRDLGRDRPDVFARAEALPFRDASMDTVLGVSMLNLLPEPRRMLDEAHRMLRPGGVLILEFTQMAPACDGCPDYLRFTREGSVYLLERAGFEPVDIIPIGGLMARVGLSAIRALNRFNRGRKRVLTEVPVRLLYVVLQLLFESLDRACLDPREVLAHLVVARRRADRT